MILAVIIAFIKQSADQLKKLITVWIINALAYIGVDLLSFQSFMAATELLLKNLVLLLTVVYTVLQIIYIIKKQRSKKFNENFKDVKNGN